MITTIGIYISYHLLFRLITLDYERRSDIINCQLLILTSQNIFKWETWLNPSQDQKILATCLAGSFDFDKTFLSSFEFWLKKSVIPNQLQFYLSIAHLKCLMSVWWHFMSTCRLMLRGFCIYFKSSSCSGLKAQA